MKNIKSFKISPKFIFIIAALVIVVFGLCFIFSQNSKLNVDEIIINKVYKIDNLGEFSIRRVNMTSSLVDNDPNTYVEVTCDFVNKTKEAYMLSNDTASIYAVGKDSQKTYNQENIIQFTDNTKSSYMMVANALPEIKTEVTMAVVVPKEEQELIITLVFGEEEFSFYYNIGDVLRDCQKINVNDSFELDNVMSVTINDVAYASYLCAPNPYSGSYHHSYPIPKDDMVYLVFDINYMNLASSYIHPFDNIWAEVRFDEDYIFEGETFYLISNDGKEIKIGPYEEDFAPLTDKHLYVAVKVSKAFIEKDVEVSFFVSDKEYVFKGTPRYEEKFGM